MKRYIRYILFAWLPFLVACEREIPYTGEYQDPKLVIETQLCAGEDSLICYITRSYFFLDRKPAKPEALENVSLQIDGTSGAYTILRDSIAGCAHHIRLSRSLLAGDTVTVSASHPQFGTASAQECLLPDYTPEVVSVVWEKDSADYEKNLLHVKLRMPDSAYPDKIISMESRMYITTTSIYARYDTAHVFQRFDTIVAHHYTTYLASADELFADLNRYSKIRQVYMGNPELLFEAEQAKSKEVEFPLYIGSKYDFHPSDNAYRTYHIDSCKMTFTAASDTYDLYQSSMKVYWNMNDRQEEEYDLGAMLSNMIGIEEPAAIYSNVENGYGIVMSKTKTTIRVK